MVDFVAFLESAEDGDRILDAWLIDHHRLEPAFEGGILFNVFPIFVQRGRADRAEFAARELGFEKIRGIHRPLGGTRTDDGVEFVNKENDLAFARCDFF